MSIITSKRALCAALSLLLLATNIPAYAAKADEKASFSYTEATVETIESYMTETDRRIEEIKNSPTDVTVSGTKYYVSSTGSDTNDGLSPESAWKSINKVNSFSFEKGDGVFFNRSDSWRITSPLVCKSGVTYSAYGDGAKPKLIASLCADGAQNWLETEYEGVYRYAKSIPASNSVGTIVFDGGRAWGVQVNIKPDGTRIVNYTDRFNDIFNGLKHYRIKSEKLTMPADLKNDLEFYHDTENETLYLCSANANPGERFASIEIVDGGHAVTLEWSNIVVDNLEIFGTGSHGISSGGAINVTVQNCVLSWIGGSVQSRGGEHGVIRYGNAVEVYGPAENFTIRNNYATQVYDCCWTVQNGSPTTFKNVAMYDNVSEFCNSGLEIWEGGGTIENMQLHDNYTRFNGYGWSHQRCNGGGSSFYGASNKSGSYRGNDIYNNVTLFASEAVMFVGATGTEQYNFHDNVYVMENSINMGFIPRDPGNGVGDQRWVSYTDDALSEAYETGFERGSKFYYTEPSPFGDMFALSKVVNGVEVFDDISDDFWGRDAIDYVTLKGLFSGMTTTEFAADRTMTRGMLATVLYRLAETSGFSSSSYTDVSDAAWFAPAVAWAEQNNITDRGGEFRPNDNITRGEIADMLYRYAKTLYKASNADTAPSFTDIADIDQKQFDGISFCTSNGIISGYSDGSVRADGSATRAEVATMIMRFTRYLGRTDVDKESALKATDTECIVLNGDTLANMIDRNLLRSRTNDDGSIRFTTFTESGEPEIRIYNMRSNKVLFSDHTCAIIKYKSNLDPEKLTATIGYTVIGGWESYSPISLTPRIDTEKGYIFFDYTDEIKALGSNSKSNAFAFHIYPWGMSNTELHADEYFELECILLYNNDLLAELVFLR